MIELMLSVDLSAALGGGERLPDFSSKGEPAFVGYEPDWKVIGTAYKKYNRYQNVIVVGNGGSVNSLRAYHAALSRFSSKKRLFIVDTPEPDYLRWVSGQCPKASSVVFVVSKSGTNSTPLQGLFFFLQERYRLVAITGKVGALREVSERLKLDVILHPQLGGRYSGFSETHLVVAKLLGVDVKGLVDGARGMFKRCSPKVKANPALTFSNVLYKLDKQGFSEVFLPLYSQRFADVGNAIVQLMHESVGKRGKGQTFYTALAPESQHHTNQRFFGGKKNVVGVFVVAKEQAGKLSIAVPKSLADIPLRDGRLNDVAGIPYAKALEFEYLGTKQDAVERKIPNLTLSLAKVDAYNLGELLAFWMYVAVYSSWLRGVDPFDQPQVERSKEIGVELLRKYHRKGSEK